MYKLLITDITGSNFGSFCNWGGVGAIFAAPTIIGTVTCLFFHFTGSQLYGSMHEHGCVCFQEGLGRDCLPSERVVICKLGFQ